MNRVSVSAIVHATEDSRKVAKAMAVLSSGQMPLPEGRKLSGHYGNEIRILESSSRNSAFAEKFLLQLWSKFSLVDREEIVSNMASYVDDYGRLFLRVDKQLAFEGKLKLGQAEPIKIEIAFDLRGKLPTVESIRGRLEALTPLRLEKDL